MIRNPVGIQSGVDNSLVTVCNDGSTWVKIGMDWREMQPVPGTIRDVELHSKLDPDFDGLSFNDRYEQFRLDIYLLEKRYGVKVTSIDVLDDVGEDEGHN